MPNPARRRRTASVWGCLPASSVWGCFGGSSGSSWTNAPSSPRRRYRARSLASGRRRRCDALSAPRPWRDARDSASMVTPSGTVRCLVQAAKAQYPAGTGSHLETALASAPIPSSLRASNDPNSKGVHHVSIRDTAASSQRCQPGVEVVELIVGRKGQDEMALFLADDLDPVRHIRNALRRHLFRQFDLD